MAQVVFSDINTRIINPNVDKFLTTDAETVFQSIWRLITTHEGEIPYFRAYGCNLKRFEQLPLTETTADRIFEYLTKKVETWETRGELVSANAKADYNNNTLYLQLVVRCKATNETGVLPDLKVELRG
nr:MAG TPA: baseplate wedge subunit [Caudoviricetes sp.]